MTKLFVEDLISPTDGALTSANFSGSVVQVKVQRTDLPLTYTTGTAGVEMLDLGVTIAPKFATSLILCFFQVHGEGATTHDYIYSVWRAGSQTNLFNGYPPYNKFAGNSAWSGIAQALPYETDYNSTPFTKLFWYVDLPGDTLSRKYSPGIKSSTATTYTYYVNRTLGSATGASAHEVGVSYSVAMEIAI